MSYRRVISVDRLRIKDGLDAGLSKTAIAGKLGLNKSTIGREVTRSQGLRGYCPKQAQALAASRETDKHGPYKMDPVMMARIIERLELLRRTMANDRGQEFSDHRIYTGKVKIKVYFCDPSSSYRRGTDKNRIGLLRQYLPKKTDITNLSKRELEKVELANCSLDS